MWKLGTMAAAGAIAAGLAAAPMAPASAHGRGCGPLCVFGVIAAGATVAAVLSGPPAYGYGPPPAYYAPPAYYPAYPAPAYSYYPAPRAYYGAPPVAYTRTGIAIYP
ncbi:MAG: hypothetical protein ACREFD_15650 [Stellaceae bacterium]